MMVRSFAELPTTTSMLINELGERTLEAQIRHIARTGQPMHRMDVRRPLEPIREKSQTVARMVEQHPCFRAALWLARRSKKHD